MIEFTTPINNFSAPPPYPGGPSYPAIVITYVYTCLCTVSVATLRRYPGRISPAPPSKTKTFHRRLKRGLSPLSIPPITSDRELAASRLSRREFSSPLPPPRSSSSTRRRKVPPSFSLADSLSKRSVHLLCFLSAFLRFFLFHPFCPSLSLSPSLPRRSGVPAIGRGYLSIIKTIRSYRLSRTGAVVFSALSINVLIDFGPLPRGRPSPPILSSARFLPPLVAARRARVIDLHIYLLSFYCLVYTVPRYLYRIILGNGQVRSFIAGTVKRFDPIIPFFPSVKILPL